LIEQKNICLAISKKLIEVAEGVGITEQPISAEASTDELL
jgi:hypothetical protein